MDKASEIHQLVESGSLDDFRAALERGAPVNAPGHIGMTPLMGAIRAESLDKMKLLVEHGADIELTDDFNNTALRLAAHADFIEGVQYLLILGAERGHHPRDPLKKIEREARLPDLPIPENLQGVLSEEEWKESLERTAQLVKEQFDNPTVRAIISEVQSVEALRLFLEAGDDLSLAPHEVQRALLGLKDEEPWQATLEDYQQHKSPRFGTQNPERMDNPFWCDMVRIGGGAYSARQQFDDTSPFTNPGAVWCISRYGSTLTPLPDGRFVQIAGEHEDYYDPDFAIYNDVIVYDGRGNFQIYGYPRDIFPPTDFHTATLVGDSIYLIGCIGYPDDRRAGFTPVYRLSLDTWAIQLVETTGDMPGWLHCHRAWLLPDQKIIHIEGGLIHVNAEEGETDLIPNTGRFELNLQTARWRRLD